MSIWRDHSRLEEVRHPDDLTLYGSIRTGYGTIVAHQPKEGSPCVGSHRSGSLIMPHPRLSRAVCGAWSGTWSSSEAAVPVGRGVRVVKVNTDMAPETAQRFNVRSIPTLVFFKDGDPEFEMVGLVPKPVLEREIDGLVDGGGRSTDRWAARENVLRLKPAGLGTPLDDRTIDSGCGRSGRRVRLVWAEEGWTLPEASHTACQAPLRFPTLQRIECGRPQRR